MKDVGSKEINKKRKKVRKKEMKEIRKKTKDLSFLSYFYFLISFKTEGKKEQA